MNCKSDSDRNTNPNKQIDDTGRSVSISHSTITPCPMDVGTAARCKWWSWSRGQEKKTARSTVCTVEEDCRASGIGFISTLSSSLLLCSPFWLVDHSRLSSALLSCLSLLLSPLSALSFTPRQVGHGHSQHRPPTQACLHRASSRQSGRLQHGWRVSFASCRPPRLSTLVTATCMCAATGNFSIAFGKLSLLRLGDGAEEVGWV
jgi:hypothetical protein